MDAEDRNEEQRHQADALQAPSAVLSVRPGWRGLSLAQLFLAEGQERLECVTDPACCCGSLYFICSDLIIKVRISLAFERHFWTGFRGYVFTK